MEKQENGGKGSGNFDHLGRPGEVGGSGDGMGMTVAEQKKQQQQGKQGKQGAKTFEDYEAEAFAEAEKRLESDKGRIERENKLVEKLKQKGAHIDRMSRNALAEHPEAYDTIEKSIQEARDSGLTGDIDITIDGLGDLSDVVKNGQVYTTTGGMRVSKNGNWDLRLDSRIFSKEWKGQKETRGQKFAQVLDSTPSGIMRHEMGHAITRMIMPSYLRDKNDSSWEYECQQILKRSGATRNGNSMSRYGYSKASEALAEAWSNPDYSDETRQIVDYMKSELKKRKNATTKKQAGEELCIGYPKNKNQLDKMLKAYGAKIDENIEQE